MYFSNKIVLASHSPRRSQLLEQAEVQFIIRARLTDESFPADLPLEEVPVYIAKSKALAVQPECRKDELIIAADTLVMLDNEIIGKPADERDAIEMLKKLSGNRHRVITGVCLLKGETMKSFSETTEVYFRTLSEPQILHYLSKYKPYDKAGAYAIQEWIGLIGIEKIKGDYFNVMGLPVGRVVREIANWPS